MSLEVVWAVGWQPEAVEDLGELIDAEPAVVVADGGLEEARGLWHRGRLAPHLAEAQREQQPELAEAQHAVAARVELAHERQERALVVPQHLPAVTVEGRLVRRAPTHRRRLEGLVALVHLRAVVE
eukprot:scaffold47117_cov65-Phaeocystis_antarctica.AAC.2